jgi:hypothetical protein
MKAIFASETSVDFQQTTRRNIPKAEFFKKIDDHPMGTTAK